MGLRTIYKCAKLFGLKNQATGLMQIKSLSSPLGFLILD